MLTADPTLNKVTWFSIDLSLIFAVTKQPASVDSPLSLVNCLLFARVVTTRAQALTLTDLISNPIGTFSYLLYYYRQFTELCQNFLFIKLKIVVSLEI